LNEGVVPVGVLAVHAARRRSVGARRCAAHAVDEVCDATLRGDTTQKQRHHRHDDYRTDAPSRMQHQLTSASNKSFGRSRVDTVMTSPEDRTTSVVYGWIGDGVHVTPSGDTAKPDTVLFTHVLRSACVL
jgi:hypothetical protein